MIFSLENIASATGSKISKLVFQQHIYLLPVVEFSAICRVPLNGPLCERNGYNLYNLIKIFFEPRIVSLRARLGSVSG